LNGIGAGSYICSIVDSYGCLFIDTLNVESPDSITATITVVDNLCFGENEGIITISDVNSEQYSVYWNDGSYGTTYDELEAGLYHFIITDQNDCTGSGSAFVSEPPPIEAVINTNPAPCFGQNGAAEYQISGGTGALISNWSPDQLLSMPPGNYYLEVMDENACSDQFPFSIEVPEPLLAEVAVTPEWELGEAGTVEITINGGTPPYTADWGNGPESVFMQNGLAAGTYEVVIQDANGCDLTLEYVIEFAIGIAQEQTEHQVFIYKPDEAYLFVTGNTQPIDSAVIFDTSGRSVLNVRPETTQYTIDLHNLAPGFYTVVVQIDQIRHTTRIMRH
jgi:hypothetical protein